MIISNDSALRRLNSADNLINRMKNNSERGGAMKVFGLENRTSDSLPFVNPFLKSTETAIIVPPKSAQEPSIKIDDILDNADTKIRMNLAHDEALGAMVDSVQQLRKNLATVESPTKLADIAAKMKGIVTAIRDDRSKSSGEGKHIHHHFYTPVQKKVADYNVIDVG